MNDLQDILTAKRWGRPRRRLAARWDVLLGGNNFQVPQSREDIQALYFKVPSIRMNYTDFFFTPSGLDLRQELIDETTAMLDCRGLSRSHVAQTLHEHLSASILRRVKSEPDDPVPAFLTAVASKLCQRAITFRVDGLELSGIEEIRRGPWRLHAFSEKDATAFLSSASAGDAWRAMLKETIDKEFKEKLCITLDVLGDPKGAEDEAARLCEGVLSGFRYAVMIHADAGDWGRRFFINRLGAPMPASSMRLSRPLNGGSPSEGRRFEGDRPYTLYERNLIACESGWHLGRYWDILAAERLSDLEQAVENSVRWLGDAASDHDQVSSFMKLWIALEALVTASVEEKLSERLSRSIPLLIWLSGVETEPDDPKLLDPIRDSVKRMYEVRCALVHGRERRVVPWRDYRRVSRWAYRCIAGSLGQLSKGVTTRRALDDTLARFSRRLGWSA